MPGCAEGPDTAPSPLAPARRQVFWITIFGNSIFLLRARRDRRAAVVRAISAETGNGLGALESLLDKVVGEDALTESNR